MANIAGVDLPHTKQIAFALRYIFGIGPMRANKICSDLGILLTKRAKDLSEEELSNIRAYIDKNYVVESDLKHKVSDDIRAKISIRSYQGLRHAAHLPVRGQRTHDNAKTRKKGRA